MLQRGMGKLVALAAVWLLGGGVAMADYTSVQIGHTGQHLRDSAGDQPKHYLGDSAALDRRLCRLMDDVDHLLVKLHAMPAQTSGTDPVIHPVDPELGRLFDIALRHNPMLDVPRSELAVLAAKTRQAGAAQDPMLSFMLMDLPALNPIRPGDIMGTGMEVTVEQEFMSYGKRGLKREIASKDEALKELELAQKEVDLMLDVTEMYYDLFGMVAKRRAVQQNLELMNILVEMSQRKLAIGAAPQAAVLSAQVQASKMQLMLTEMDAEIDQSYIKLYGMLGYPPGIDLKQELKFNTPYPLPPKVEWDNAKLEPEALSRWPAYQRQCLMKEQQNLMVEMARREYYPDYMLMGRYKAAFGMEDSYSFEVRVPLFLHKQDRQDAALQEQYAQKAVISDEAEGIAAEYFSRLETLEVELRMHSQLVDLLRGGTVPQARTALESNIASYASEMMDISDLIMAQQSLLDQETELEQNYIHILHTLTDLHVLTLGAWDPTPYNVPAEEPLGKVGAPLTSTARGVSSAVDVGWAITQRGGEFAEKYGPTSPLPQGPGFIEDLGIPKSSGTALPDMQDKPVKPKETKPKEIKPKEVKPKEDQANPEPKSKEQPAPSDANSEFYKPFVPKGKAKP